MSNIKNILNSATATNEALIKYSDSLVKKWEPLGLLEGIEKDYAKRNMATLLENQARQLMTEINATSTTAGSEEWSGVALPLIRRVFGQAMLTNEVMSVQPMNLPSGLVFYLDFQYGSTKGKFTEGNSVYGGNGKFGRTNAATGGLFGVGRYGYTINETSSVVTFTTASAGWSSIDFNPDLSASLAAGRIFELAVSTASLPERDLTAIRSFNVSGSINAFYPAFTRLSGANILFYVSASAGITTGTVTFSKQPLEHDRGDFEDKDGSNLNIPEINIELKSEPIVAKTRKLKATWTPELVQDLSAYHSINAEEELTGMLTEYVGAEIDLEMIDMLYSEALTTDFWSAKVGREVDTNGATVSDSNTAAASAYTKNEWFQTLGVKVQKLSNKIHQLTARGGANFMIVSPDVATILESIPGFQVDTNGDEMTFAMGVSKVGTFASRFKVYKVPYIAEIGYTNVILLGYRGSAFLETGAVYSPYVPLVMTPVVYDKDNFTPRKGLMTRYAKKVVRPEFYARLVILDLNHI